MNRKMYRIWFKLGIDGIDSCVDSTDLETIQKVWDMLHEAGFYMINPRP